MLTNVILNSTHIAFLNVSTFVYKNKLKIKPQCEVITCIGGKAHITLCNNKTNFLSLQQNI